MEKRFALVFDEVMLVQLKKLGEDKQVFLYEIKMKSPPLRLYYKHVKETDELYVFEYEMKTSEQKQQKTIHKIKQKAQDKFRSRDQRA